MDESFLEAACDLDGMLDCGGRMITISISDSAQSRVLDAPNSFETSSTFHLISWSKHNTSPNVTTWLSKRSLIIILTLYNIISTSTSIYCIYYIILYYIIIYVYICVCFLVGADGWRTQVGRRTEMEVPGRSLWSYMKFTDSTHFNTMTHHRKKN